MADRFYSEQELALGETTLTGAEAHHLGTVRRLEVGERVVLFNGDGRDYHAEILSIGKKSVSLVIHAIEAVNRELRFPLVAATAVPKGDRAEFLVEKLTELGVTCWIPLSCQRSVAVPNSNKLAKFQHAVIEASKQCGRNRLMQVQPVAKLPELLGRHDLSSCKLILHTADTFTRNVLSRPEPTIILVGPEGGFTEEEVEAALNAGWQGWSLGPRIVRVETAAVAAAAILSQCLC